MRVLITGITGFAGSHLAQVLLEQGDEVFGVAHQEGLGLAHVSGSVDLTIADLRQAQVVDELLAQIRPEAIYHLAGQASVSASWQNPWDTLENNIRPQMHILQAMVAQKLAARLLIVASNQVYGHIEPDQLPVNEETPLQPDNPYGVSKVTQDILGLQYYLSQQVDVLRVRAFNHIGPRQSPDFVAASFARQIARIEAGLSEPVLKVGNLSTQRDFTDVRDVVRAYALLVKHGEPGAAYNLGTGQAYSIQYLLDTLLSYTPVEIRVEIEKDRMRPSDMPIIYADNSKLRTATGWKPCFAFEDSLRLVLDYWRKEVTKIENQE